MEDLFGHVPAEQMWKVKIKRPADKTYTTFLRNLSEQQAVEQLAFLRATHRPETKFKAVHDNPKDSKVRRWKHRSDVEKAKVLFAEAMEQATAAADGQPGRPAFIVFARKSDWFLRACRKLGHAGEEGEFFTLDRRVNRFIRRCDSDVFARVFVSVLQAENVDVKWG